MPQLITPPSLASCTFPKNVHDKLMNEHMEGYGHEECSY